MATYASRPVVRLRARSPLSSRVLVPAGLLALMGLAAALRIPGLGVGFWIDEGLSVGIADRPLTDIPGVLRQDGSPPLYYLLLSAWMRVFGTSEAATHAMSLTATILAVPAGYVVARHAFGERAGWMAALLFATNPFLSQYAQETRMYTLVTLLALVVVGCWLAAMLADAGPVRRAPGAGLAVSLALLLYTHNWGLFLAAATGVAWLWLLAGARGQERGRLLRTGLAGYGGAVVLYAPWVPTLLYQAANTGAPWSNRPGLSHLASVPANLLTETGALMLAVIGGAGIVALVRPGLRDRRSQALVAVALMGAGTVLLAWLASQASPAWAGRYLAVAVPPILLLCAAGLAAMGALGLVTLACVAVIWAADAPPREKSSVRSVSQAILPSLEPGDVVVSTQPETVSVLRYYLGDDKRYASLTGFVPAPGVTDWRDGVDRLEASTPARDLAPILDGLPAGARLVLVVPQVHDEGAWRAPWTALVRRRSEAWKQYLSNDERFRRISVEPPSPLPRRAIPVRAEVYEKV